MLSFYSAASIAAAPTIVTNPTLQALLADRVQDWRATELMDLTHLLIIEPGDTEQDIIREAGFSPLENPLDGRRSGSTGFIPPFDYLQLERGGWFELIMTVGNSGFAFVLFIPDNDEIDPDLLSLCRAYAGGGTACGSC